MPDQDHLRRLALALPEAAEQPHFDRTSFRVRGKIFATFAPGTGRANLALPPELAAAVLETEVEAVRAINWGSIRGWVDVDLERVSAELLATLVSAAWTRVAPKRLAAAHASEADAKR